MCFYFSRVASNYRPTRPRPSIGLLEGSRKMKKYPTLSDPSSTAAPPVAPRRRRSPQPPRAPLRSRRSPPLAAPAAPQRQHHSRLHRESSAQMARGNIRVDRAEYIFYGKPSHNSKDFVCAKKNTSSWNAFRIALGFQMCDSAFA